MSYGPHGKLHCNWYIVLGQPHLSSLNQSVADALTVISCSHLVSLMSHKRCPASWFCDVQLGGGAYLDLGPWSTISRQGQIPGVFDHHPLPCRNGLQKHTKHTSFDSTKDRQTLLPHVFRHQDPLDARPIVGQTTLDIMWDRFCGSREEGVVRFCSSPRAPLSAVLHPPIPLTAEPTFSRATYLSTSVG